MSHMSIEGNEIFFIAPSDPIIAAATPTVHVVDFVGSEGLSKLYQYEFTLATTTQVNLETVLNLQVVFYARENKDVFFIHGIISSIDEIRKVDNYYFYKATVVPKMWELTQTIRSEIYLNKSIPEIIEQVLNTSGFTSPGDYEILLGGRSLPTGADPNDYDSNFYRKWEYVCQHQETNFNFISRWMEREGIYYFFEQYQDKTKIIFTDSKDIHLELLPNLLTTPSTTLRDTFLATLPTAPGPYHLMEYSPPSGLETVVKALCVSSMIVRKKLLPNQVVLQDFNYRDENDPVIVGSSIIEMPEISPSALPAIPPVPTTITSGPPAVMSKEVHIYGEHVKNIDEANLYAEIRAEEISCKGIVFSGESTIPYLRPGYLYSLRKHFRTILNSDDTNYPATPLYLVTDVHHEGGQAPLIFGGTNVPLPPEETKGYYRNTFESIQDHVQYRAEKTTPKPRFYGTINAKVTAEGSDTLPEVDDQGRYRVKMPFDRSDNTGNMASRPVRMAQPYAGSNTGLHFPLHEGTEVLLTFIYGDPDRPIIAGAVPGANDVYLITDTNTEAAGFQTLGSTLTIDDSDGGEQLQLASGTAAVALGNESGNSTAVTAAKWTVAGGGLGAAAVGGLVQSAFSFSSSLTFSGGLFWQAAMDLATNLASGAKDVAQFGTSEALDRGRTGWAALGLLSPLIPILTNTIINTLIVENVVTSKIQKGSEYNAASFAKLGVCLSTLGPAPPTRGVGGSFNAKDVSSVILNRNKPDILVYSTNGQVSVSSKKDAIFESRDEQASLRGNTVEVLAKKSPTTGERKLRLTDSSISFLNTSATPITDYTYMEMNKANYWANASKKVGFSVVPTGTSYSLQEATSEDNPALFMDKDKLKIKVGKNEVIVDKSTNKIEIKSTDGEVKISGEKTELTLDSDGCLLRHADHGQVTLKSEKFLFKPKKHFAVNASDKAGMKANAVELLSNTTVKIKGTQVKIA